MTWEDALEIVVPRGKCERYRELCAEDNPDVHQRDAYRASVLEQATGEPPPPPPPAEPFIPFSGCCGG
jgi:hypothetical protein